MATHTPTPWRNDGLTIRAKCNEIVVADVCGPSRRARGKEWQEDHDYCYGNAAFIAKACNAHEQLVAAAKAALDMICEEVADGAYTAQAALLREALAEAEAQ